MHPIGYHEVDASVGRRVAEFGRTFAVPFHRLLTENGLAEGRCRLDVLQVERVRRNDVDRVVGVSGRTVVELLVSDSLSGTGGGGSDALCFLRRTAD